MSMTILHSLFNILQRVNDLLVWYPDKPVLCIYLLKNNGVIVPYEIHENCPGKNIYRKDSKFSEIIWTNSAN